jgi:hypothetical protein
MHTYPCLRSPGPPSLPTRRRRPRGVTVTHAALLDPPTFLDECFEILRRPEIFRLLRERERVSSGA